MARRSLSGMPESDWSELMAPLRKSPEEDSDDVLRTLAGARSPSARCAMMSQLPWTRCNPGLFTLCKRFWSQVTCLV